jgi:hypothetical protein
MTSNNRLIALGTSLLLLMAVPAANAAIQAAATFDDKVENAASIILGKCVKSESRLDPSGRWILTYSTFNVEKSLKGVAPQQITLVVPGGTVGSLHQETIGMPTFREGDEHVVFVKNTRFGPTVLYFDQGAYSVTKDDRGDKIVTPIPTNVVKVDTQRGMAVAPNDLPRNMRDFEQAVSDSLRDSRERRIRMDAMAAEKARRESSLWSIVARNKFFVLIALAGIALATWQLLRR